MSGEAVPIPMRLLPHAVDGPYYASDGAAGADLFAAVPLEAPVTLRPGEVEAIPTGVALALPDGVEAQIRPRSGLARKHRITLLNAPGTIDWDYRGEIQALLINLGRDDFVVDRGLRIAQLVLAPVLRGAFSAVEDLDQTVRGAGGFGSTGLGGGVDAADKKR